VDSILGSNKMLHTIIESECTGCNLCIPVCPVDCISIITDPNPDWNNDRIINARLRYETHNMRLERDQLARSARLVKYSKK